MRYNIVMSQSASAIVRSPAEIVQNSPVSQAPNGICYARSGEITIADNDLERMIAAVPVPVASSLTELLSSQPKRGPTPYYSVVAITQ